MRYVQSQFRKAEILRLTLFFSLVALILVFMFELLIVQIYTNQRNAGRNIHTSQFNLHQHLTEISRLVSMYYLNSADVTGQLASEEQNLLLEHRYLLTHSISLKALSITKSGEIIFDDLIYRIDVITKTHPGFVIINFEKLIDDSTAYSEIIDRSFYVYTQLLEQSNNAQGIFLTAFTLFEIGILLLLAKLIISTLNNLLESVFMFVELQENLKAERRINEELIVELPLHLSDVKVDVVQIDKNIFQVVGQNSIHTVSYVNGRFVCDQQCNVFRHAKACLHTRRARWFRSKVSSLVSLQ